MKYKRLGNTGVKVSSLCFGTMSFGGDADEATSTAMFNRCREAGINFFDCANVYAGGRSEEILGKLIADCRDELVITTKFYGAMGTDINARGGSRYNLRQSIEGSLRRLDTDRIDVYFIHMFDEETPIEETLRGLDDLVRQGKILYPAASNYAAWQVAKALGISAQRGWARYEVIQPMYNLVKRQVEVEILPMAKSENLGVIPYSPLGGGLLTGKYGPAIRPESGRLVENRMYRKRYSEEWVFEVAGIFAEFARELGYDPAALAVAWVGSHPAVTAPIIGARNMNQLEESLKSIDIDMTPELRTEISALSPTPPIATDRAEEKES
jgi:aryl-alcohol dehydrogenase-like predicted oxidoreductase